MAHRNGFTYLKLDHRSLSQSRIASDVAHVPSAIPGRAMRSSSEHLNCSLIVAMNRK
jgi:hypothetical protein